MPKTGLRVNSLKQQRINAELEEIIEEFGRTMRSAYKPYIATYVPACKHEVQIPFTPHMEEVWEKYVDWCVRHGDEDKI